MDKKISKTKSSKKSSRSSSMDGEMYNAVTGTTYDIKGGKIVGMRRANN